MAAGDYHTCGLQPSGYVDCWGLEGDWTTDRSGPFSWITAGYYHNCAIRASDGTAECWGQQLVWGDRTSAGRREVHEAGDRREPRLRDHPERDVKCWGGNTWGQAPKLRAGPYTQIGAGDLFTCGLKATGEIDCWGYNFFGQTNAPDGAWTTLGVGDAYACASNTDTGVWQCWGWNLYGNAPHNKDLPRESSPEKDPPVVQIILTPPEPDGANGWYRNPVNVDPQASDDSSIAELRCMLDPPYVPASFDTLSPEPCAFLGGNMVGGERTHTFYTAAKDPWGNVSEVASISFKIDATPPKLICPQVQPFLLGSGPYQVGVSVSDFVSGVDKANSTLFGHVATDTVGPKSATFTAIDFAGNSATKECAYSVIYDFAGFFPPVKPPCPEPGQGRQRDPAEVQPGRRPGTRRDQGGVSSVHVAGTTNHGSERQPATNPRRTTGKSGLAYDPLSDQYTYVWKTEKAWSGTCQYLSLQLMDGTEQRAAFQFK